MHMITIVAYVNWLQDFNIIDDQKILLQHNKYIDLFDLAQKNIVLDLIPDPSSRYPYMFPISVGE